MAKMRSPMYAFGGGSSAGETLTFDEDSIARISAANAPRKATPVEDYADKMSSIDEQSRARQMTQAERMRNMGTQTAFPLAKAPPMSPAAEAPDSYYGDMRRPNRTAPKTSPRSPLKKGVYNNDAVGMVQRDLNDIAEVFGDMSMNVGAVDNDFGGNTENAVRSFQARFNLPVTGVVDNATRQKIDSVRQRYVQEKNRDLHDVGSPAAEAMLAMASSFPPNVINSLVTGNVITGRLANELMARQTDKPLRRGDRLGMIMDEVEITGELPEQVGVPVKRSPADS
jgi:peptidoglycan hydrolase-like protein with peptidoglycan-binding domain